jgi:hypothetical protein
VEESRLTRQMRDPILVEFFTHIRDHPIAMKLPGAVTRLLVKGGPLRNLFARTQLDDLAGSAKVLHALIEHGQIASVSVGYARESLQSDMRRVTALTGAGLRMRPPNPYFLYLPAGRGQVRLIDEPAATLLQQRRSTAWWLSLLNVALVLLLGVIFYGDAFNTTNPGLAVIIGMVWLAGQFAFLYWVHVHPVVQRLGLFPAFLPAGPGPAHLSGMFVADAWMSNLAKRDLASGGEPGVHLQPYQARHLFGPHGVTSGLVLIALAAFALYANRNLPLVSGFHIEAGGAPLALSLMLLPLGAVIALQGLSRKRMRVPVSLMPLLVVSLAVIVFMITIEPLRLVLAMGLSTAVVSLYGLRGRRRMALLVALIIATVIGLSFLLNWRSATNFGSILPWE